MSYPQFGYPYPSVAGGLASAQLLTTAATTPTSISPATSCCEGGRPIMTDPTTGQTICSCQYPSATLLSAYPRVAGLPDSVYNSAYAAHGLMPLGTDPSAFYSPLTAGSSTAAACYPYDPTMASYPYSNGYGGVDLQARRKNATRESTNTLKAWLYEHRKNPYPTKGEKIMLAIITKMTLTQVSTWFANARRRLKKENKMTWSPRNRTGDEDDDDDKDDGDKSDTDDKDNEDGLAIDVESAADLDDMLKDDVVMSEKRDDVRSALSPAGSPLSSVCDITEHNMGKSRLENNENLNRENRLSSDRDIVSPSHTDEAKLHTKDATEKPKIWSLAQVATSQTPPPARSKSPCHIPGPQFPIRPAHTGYLPSSLSASMNGLRYTPYSLAGSNPTSLSHQFVLASRASYAMSMGHHGGHKLDTPPNTPPHSSGSSLMVTPMAMPAKPMALAPLHTSSISSSVISPTDLSKSATLQSLRDNQHGTAFKPVAIR